MEELETRKIYNCVCGSAFDNPQLFNNHKSHCKIHQIQKHGSLDFYKETKMKAASRSAEAQKRNRKNRDNILLQNWVVEQHKCEHCSKIMIEKFGSGRFCCKSCANSHVKSEESRQKTSDSTKKTYKNKTPQYYKDKEIKKKQTRLINYAKHPKYCQRCGKPIPYDRKNSKYCSKECAYKNHGGYRENASYGKIGTYKGIYCDSTYELAFLIYCIDNEIQIERCKDYFYYEYNNNQHKYYPDFYLPEYDIYIETKGRFSELVQIKANAIPDNKLIILDTDALEPIFKYLNDNYPVKCNKSNNNLYILYDK